MLYKFEITAWAGGGCADVPVSVEGAKVDATSGETRKSDWRGNMPGGIIGDGIELSSRI